MRAGLSRLRGGIRDLFRPEWITRDIGLVLLARVSMSAGRALTGVVVPIYLAVIGFSGFQLGLLFTIVAISSALMTGLIGLLSDRIGRKQFLIALPLTAAVAALVFAFSREVALLFVFAALGTFGRGAGASSGSVGPYQPAEQALLADSVEPRYRNSLFGHVAFASSLGALIGAGPLVAISQLIYGQSISEGHSFAAYRLDFLIIVALSLLAGLLVIPISNLVPERDEETPHDTGDPVTRQRANGRRGLHLSRQSWWVLLRMWAVNGSNGLAAGFFGPFITYWFYQRFGASPAEVGLLYAVINLASMISNLVAANVASRVGLVRTIVLSRILQAGLMIPMVFAPTFWLAGAFYMLRMVSQRVGLPLRQSFVMGVVPPRERGSVSALSSFPAQAGSAVTPSLAGYIFDSISLSLPFVIGAALQGCSTLLFFTFFRHLTPPEEQKNVKEKEDSESG